MNLSSLLWILYWILALGSALTVASITLIARRIGDPKYIIAFAIFGCVLILSPFFSVTEIGVTGAKFGAGGIIGIFRDAESKTPKTIADIGESKSGLISNFEGRQVLVAYRAVRLEDAKILVNLLKQAKLTPILAHDELTSPRINIPYPTGIVRIVYKNKEDRSFVEKIFDLIQYYRSDPTAEIAIGGPYENYIRGTPIQILLY